MVMADISPPSNWRGFDRLVTREVGRVRHHPPNALLSLAEEQRRRETK